MNERFDEFKELVETLQRKYMCPDLILDYYELDEDSLKKRFFDEEELEFEKRKIEDENGVEVFNAKKNLEEKNVLSLPAFYEERLNLPTTGTKYIRSTLDFYCGDLAKVTVEIGFWKLKPHNHQHKDYVLTAKKHTVCFAFYHEENRWAMLNPEEWDKRKSELDDDLSNPLLRQMELEFHDTLKKATSTYNQSRKIRLKKDAVELIQDLYELEWYIKYVPVLWAAFKLYSQDMYSRVLRRIDDVYEELIEQVDTFISEEESDIIDTQSPLMLDFYSSLNPLLFDGYENINEAIFSNLKTMYTERQPTNRFADLETLRIYKEIALELSQKKKLSFIPFSDVKKEFDLRNK